MGEIASRSQIGFSLFRRAAIAIPLVLLLGIASGRLAGAGSDNVWFAVLRKPDAMPPGAVFGIAWTLLYILQGLALAIVLNARGNRLRALAIILFVVQLALNLAWPPLFFAMHQVMPAFWLILGILIAALATTLVFGQIRAAAACAMVPYLAWLCFAGALNRDIARLNPDAARLVPGSLSTQIGG